MLNILNREVQRKLFSEENSEILISFLNQCFFRQDIKVVELRGVNDLAHPFVHCQSCFQETIMCKVKTSENKEWIIEIDVVRIHNGKNTSFMKLHDKYFDTLMNMEISYAYRLPFMYIGLFTFDIGKLEQHYHFEETDKNCQIDLHFLNIEASNFLEKEKLTAFEQWMYLFKNSSSLSALPNEIDDKNIRKIIKLLDANNWDKDDLEYYQKKENQWEERNERVLKMYREIESPLIDEYLESPAKQVKMSIRPLQNQLTPKDIKVDIGMLDKSSLQKMAFGVFRQWQKEINDKYPEITINIDDETMVFQNFKVALTDALKSLISSDSFYLDNEESWDIGYVRDYLSGTLRTAWQYEYVTKQTDNFKMLSVIQVVRDFLKFDDVKRIQIKGLYEALVKAQLNITDIDTSIKYNNFIYKGEKIEGKSVDEEDVITTALENFVNKQVREITANKNIKDVSLDIGEIVPKEVIKNLLRKNIAKMVS